MTLLYLLGDQIQHLTCTSTPVPVGPRSKRGNIETRRDLVSDPNNICEMSMEKFESDQPRSRDNADVSDIFRDLFETPKCSIDVS